MSRNLGWPERHNFSAADLREMAEALDALNAEQPQPIAWAVDVVAPEQVWERLDARRREAHERYMDRLLGRRRP